MCNSLCTEIMLMNIFPQTTGFSNQDKKLKQDFSFGITSYVPVKGKFSKTRLPAVHLLIYISLGAEDFVAAVF